VDYEHSGTPAQFVGLAVEILDVPDTAAEVIILGPDDTHVETEPGEGKLRPRKLEDMITFPWRPHIRALQIVYLHLVLWRRTLNKDFRHNEFLETRTLLSSCAFLPGMTLQRQKCACAGWTEQAYLHGMWRETKQVVVTGLIHES
jgi:hypothetical protein